jgi:hypothetical protein
MKILIIDDTAEERQKAQEAVEAKGWEAIVYDPRVGPNAVYGAWWPLMDQVDGIITDLMWNYGVPPAKPMGLLVVIHSLFINKPVVICTNARAAKGHHGDALSFIYDGYVSAEGLGDAPRPFGWIENKNWNEAADELASRITK